MKALINGRKLFGTPFYPIVGREAVSPFIMFFVVFCVAYSQECAKYLVLGIGNWLEAGIISKKALV